MKPRLLANEKFPAPSVTYLRDRDYHVDAVAEGAGGLIDREVLALAVAARVGTLPVWIGEAGVRLYSAGQPGGARADRLL